MKTVRSITNGNAATAAMPVQEASEQNHIRMTPLPNREIRMKKPEGISVRISDQRRMSRCTGRRSRLRNPGRTDSISTPP